MELNFTIKLASVHAQRLWWITHGYLWDDDAQQPVHQVTVHKLFAQAGRDVPAHIDIHHIDHNKKNNVPTNLILLSPIAHILVHMATARWSGTRPIGSLCKPEELLKFLDEGRIAYLYCGSLTGGSFDNNHTLQGDTHD